MSNVTNRETQEKGVSRLSLTMLRVRGDVGK